MTSGTKIFLAVFALLIGVLVLYYGVWQKAQPLGPATANAAGVTQPSEPPMPAPGRTNAPRTPDGIASLREQLAASQQPKPGILTNSVEGTANSLVQPSHVADSSLDSIATNTSAPAANTPLAIESASVQNRSASPPAGIDTGAITSDPPFPSKTITPSQLPMTEYTIKAGDTGVSIAKEWFGDGNKWTLISKANPWADFNRLKIGQKINLPPRDATESSISGAPQPSSAKTASKPVTMGDKTTYTVQAGDTLVKIARKHYGSDAKWEDIYNANKSVIGGDPANLKVGMKLTLPAKKS